MSHFNLTLVNGNGCLPDTWYKLLADLFKITKKLKDNGQRKHRDNLEYV